MSPRDHQQRTAEDRERARAERERRRGRSVGSAGPEQPAGSAARGQSVGSADSEQPVGFVGPEQSVGSGGPEQDVESAGLEQPVERAGPEQDVESAGLEQSVGSTGPGQVAQMPPFASAAPLAHTVDDEHPASDPAVELLGEQVPVGPVEPHDGIMPKPRLEGENMPGNGISSEVSGTSSIAAEPLHPIAVKLPRPAPLPPRIAPPHALGTRRRRWPARLRVAVLLALALAVCGGLLAFVLSHSKSTPKAVAPIAVVRVTIPEGETRAQIARIAAAKGLLGSYTAATRRSALLDPTHYGAPRSTPDLEGFLFPATYELYAGASASRLAAEQLAAFEENFGAAEIRRAHALHITPYQLLIVASMVEREALLEHDRSRVAAVIYNRLRLGMALGIDSTLRYALHDYSKPLTEAQLRLDSPYNTRIHHGLPPTPISNPGLASIQAAAHPAHVAYLYYVNGADGCGELVFSDADAEFEQDAAAYRQALAKNGGRVPTCRKH